MVFEALQNVPDDLSDFWSNIAPKMPASLPSFRSVLMSGSQIALNAQSWTSSAPSCPSNGQISCHNTSVVENLCCFNAPGGMLLQTQFWDTNPPTGPDDSWTIHGLWPDNCDGTYDANCDPSRAYSNITAILEEYGATDLLDYMDTYWKDYQGDDENLWEHEWAKHGTCVSTLDTSCYSDYQTGEEAVDYFQAAVSLYKTLPTYDWLSEAGIVPSNTDTYTRDQIQDVLTSKHGKPVSIGCKSSKLDEIWYFFDVQGSVQTGTFIAANPDGGKSTCPATGIRYPPKDTAQPTGTRTATRPAAPTATGPPFAGKGFLNVLLTSGAKQGCLISSGEWYTSGTCATYRATAKEDDGFTLSTSKGKCAVTDDALTCAASVTEASVFTAEKSLLGFGGKTSFYADGVPRGLKKSTVFVAQSDHAMALEIEWQNV